MGGLGFRVCGLPKGLVQGFGVPIRTLKRHCMALGLFGVSVQSFGFRASARWVSRRETRRFTLRGSLLRVPLKGSLKGSL